MRMATMPNMCGRLLCASHPRALGLSLKLRGWGSGGSAECRTMTVYAHQPTSITTITVTSFMIWSAFSLDSGMPLVLSPQQYEVTTMAKTEAIPLIETGEKGPLRCACLQSSLTTPPRDCPADTPLISPLQ